MKTLNSYIIEKQSFLIKKHVDDTADKLDDEFKDEVRKFRINDFNIPSNLEEEDYWGGVNEIIILIDKYCSVVGHSLKDIDAHLCGQYIYGLWDKCQKTSKTYIAISDLFSCYDYDKNSPVACLALLEHIIKTYKKFK